MSKVPENCKCEVHRNMRKNVDEGNAPQGYKAVKGFACYGCSFEFASDRICGKKKCCDWQREDKRHVIFVEVIA